MHFVVPERCLQGSDSSSSSSTDKVYLNATHLHVDQPKHLGTNVGVHLKHLIELPLQA